MLKPKVFRWAVGHPKTVLERQALLIIVKIKTRLRGIPIEITFVEGQLLTAINHHRSRDDLNVRFPVQR